MAQVESSIVALEELTLEQRERLRAAVRILIDYLLETASLNEQNQTQTEAESELATEPQAVQLCLEL
jgi:hypothetical protein